MSTTPKTDAACFSATTEKPESGDFELTVVDVEVARKLELENRALRAVLTDLSETGGIHQWSTAANNAFIAALNKARALLQP